MSVGLCRTLAAALSIALVGLLAGCTALTPPVSDAEVADFTAPLARELASVQEPPAGVLTADDAVDRAVRHNQALRVKELEAALSVAKVSVQAGAMLPSIVAESAYYRRDRPMLSHSSGSPVYSTSADPRSISRDIALSWNILDFGLSYVRSRQALDRAWQAQEEARRVAMRIVEETRSTYWRAVALQKLQPEVKRLDREIAAMLALAGKAAADTQLDPMVSINYQRDILNAQRDLNQLDIALAGATDQLKQSVGLSSMPTLHLDRFHAGVKLDKPTESAEDDIAIALAQRPEIRQSMYDTRITSDEVYATILQVLPGISLNRTFSQDSNSFLLHSHWISWGAQVAGNLIGLLRLPANLDSVEAQQAINRQSALATAAAIVMQVHVSRARVAVQLRAYRDAVRFARAQRQLLDQVRISVRVGRASQQALLREKLAMLLAEVREIVAFADVQAAWAAYRSARGDTTWRDPTPAPAPAAQGWVTAQWVKTEQFFIAE